MQSIFSKILLVSIAIVSSVRADYYIDDQNLTSLLYSENPAGAKWGPFQEGGETLSISLANGTLMTVDASDCFNYTYTYAACVLADDCHLQIPFTGSGITIYVLQAGAQGVNASLTIDGGAPEYEALPAPSGPKFYTPNVTLFSIQGITTGNHTATMTVQDWDNIFSGMMFDYAVINQTIVSAGSVASSTPASTPTPTASSSSSKPIGAIVGGIVGGLAALVVLLFAFFYLRRRRRESQRLSINLDADTRMEPFLVDSPYHQWPQEYTDVTKHPITESIVTGTVSAYTPPFATSSRSSSAQSPLASTSLSTSQITDATVTSPSQAGTYKTSSIPSEISRPRIQQTHPTITDHQADFVNNLHMSNVPAGAIARVIERMMAGEGRPSVDEFDSLPPPSYYHGTGEE